jgi:transposase
MAADSDAGFPAADGMRLVEVYRPRGHARGRRGKSDPIDAEAAARKVLADEVTAVPEATGGIVEAIRMLRVARQGAVKGRTAALNQLRELLVTAPEPLRRQISSSRKTLAGQVVVCARFYFDFSIALSTSFAPSAYSFSSFGASV